MKAAAALRVRVRIDFGAGASLGPGKVALLEEMARGGSLMHAATELEMSYRRAWALLTDLNQAFGVPVAIAKVGGSGGGGAELTPFAHALIEAYRAVERTTEAAATKRFAKLQLPRTRGALRRPVTRKRASRPRSKTRR